MMINYDLPWNPMRIEQRIGRIDRRGQQSEAVNIYNIITEDTVDAEIYYRCLMRIGVFEQSIGDCEQILGDIATGIESIALDTTLTEEERKIKLEQMADNEVRKVQELTRLEEEEKELFGFDLTEFTTSQEIRKAENPWLTQQCLQRLIENYINQRVGAGTYIIGETGMKNLRLSANARGILRDDLRQLPGGRNALRRTWENYLRGKKPNHTLTFDPEMAMKDRKTVNSSLCSENLCDGCVVQRGVMNLHHLLPNKQGALVRSVLLGEHLLCVGLLVDDFQKIHSAVSDVAEQIDAPEISQTFRDCRKALRINLRAHNPNVKIRSAKC